MIKIVVDTNILFSAILNIDSRIGQILVTEQKSFEFFAPMYARQEIFYHKSKIQKLARVGDQEFLSLYEVVTRNLIK